MVLPFVQLLQLEMLVWGLTTAHYSSWGTAGLSSCPRWGTAGLFAGNPKPMPYKSPACCQQSLQNEFFGSGAAMEVPSLY